MKLLNRFGDKITKKGLRFDYDLGDILLCKDGHPKIVTDFGIYDNQYWTESYYPDGIHLGAGNYINCDEIFAKSADKKQVDTIMKSYIKAIEDNRDKFSSDRPKAIKQTKIHLSFYKNLLKA